ncbi:hypothetical protein BamMEX5DRAFT_6178 [Burkholderia ambifaria MEX-5]|uniref:Uncharacterized protein n=1 Tax=Burkholderia ambifaria MEX-5 TaxID=396597 RepID=B1TEG2_9BURK|nr:hypothetical protein BamMEX5DRAFT_6178 [Burkholderia ambifaria MEX-5]
MSPCASGSVLPCSAVSVCAIRSRLRRTRSWNFSMMRSRAPIGVVFQVWNARCADAIAASTSSSVAYGTRPITSCVAGLTMSPHSALCESTNAPSISSLAVGRARVVWGTAAFMAFSGKR